MKTYIAHLIEAGLIEFTIPLIWHQPDRRETHHAELLPSGLIRYDGRTFGSPSSAAKAASGGGGSGWTDWRLPDGRTLDDLRAVFESQ